MKFMSEEQYSELVELQSSRDTKGKGTHLTFDK